MPGFLVTKARITLAAASIGLLGAVGGGIARVEMSQAKLDDIATRTTQLETAREAQALQLDTVATKLDDMKETLVRIESKLDRK